MIKTLTYSFTTPVATATYTDADLVANSATATAVVPMSWHLGSQGGKVSHIRLTKSDGSDVANATFTVHFFGSSPTPANGDDGAISYNVTASQFLGKVALPIMVAGTDDGSTQVRLGDTGFLEPLVVGYPTLYGLLEAKAAYTRPTLEVFVCTITVES
jgi:hypothetical protein